MRSSFAALALSAAALGLVVPACAKAPSPAEKQITALEAQYAAAFNAKDVASIMKVYIPNETLFVFDVTVPRQYVGWQAYRKDWTDFFAMFQGPVQMEMSDLAVTAEGTIGYSHSIQHVSGTGTDGKPLEFTVRVTDVYRKIKGSWYIVHEHVSVPMDPATGKSDTTSKP